MGEIFAKELKDEVVCRSFDGSDGSSDEGESSRSRSNSENNGLVSSAESQAVSNKERRGSHSDFHNVPIVLQRAAQDLDNELNSLLSDAIENRQSTISLLKSLLLKLGNK